MSKKAIECIPSPQGEFTEADYDLGVVACAFSTRTTLAGQVCVASDDSTLGGYCMDPPPPPPFTYADGQRLLRSASVIKAYLFKTANIMGRTNQVLHQSISVIVIIERESFSVRRHLKKFRTIPVNLKLELGFTMFMMTPMARCTVERNAIFFGDSAKVCCRIYPQRPCDLTDGQNCESCYSLDGLEKTVQDCPTDFDN